jgi:drug/metabolite transporter superfamily protein YnfA
MKYLTMAALLILATVFEATGDAVIRVGLHSATTPSRLLLMVFGASILFCYGLTLNLAPLDWGRLIGAYVATFFVVAQIINLIAFRTPPSLPIVVGGLFILTGGAIVTLWQR